MSESRLITTNPTKINKPAPLRVSASQVKKYIECPQRWVSAYIHKVREPTTLPLVFGTIFHWAVEYYLVSKGRVCLTLDELRKEYIKDVLLPNREHLSESIFARDLEQLVTMGLQDGGYDTILRLMHNSEAKLRSWIRSDSVCVEEEITGTIIEGVTYTGAIDLYNIHHESKTIYIMDHKTSSAVKWLETKETIVKNFQLGWYAYHLRIKLKALIDDGYRFVVGHFQYLKTGSNEVRSVISVMTNEHIDAIWSQVVEASRGMLKLKSLYEENPSTDAEIYTDRKVELNKQSCRIYGGCKINKYCFKGMNVAGIKKHVSDGGK